MRIVFLLSCLALLAPGLSHAQPAPTLEVATDREYYHSGGSGKIYLEAHVGTTPGQHAPTEVTRNIAFVLDQSGSMAGAPIQALRRALSTTLSSLRKQDFVSVVLFGSEVETLLEARPRGDIEDIDSLLAKIEPAGGAALYDALNQGAAQIRRQASPSTINHLILVSGSPPTKGPREPVDFSKLAEAFKKEGITLSTIGVGQNFSEDLLALLARAGNGTFHFAAQPEKLPEALQGEIAPSRALVARDAVLTVEYTDECKDPTSYGWKQPVIAENKITYQLPYVFAEEDLRLLTSAVVTGRRFSYTPAIVRLRWNDLTTGAPVEIKKSIRVEFDTDDTTVRKSVNPDMVRTSAITLMSEGMQRAIEQIDKGNFRRAMKELRNARDDAESMNEEVGDLLVKAKIKLLETYLAEVKTRGMNQLDRKILRSGLYNQFETPTAEEQKDK